MPSSSPPACTTVTLRGGNCDASPTGVSPRSTEQLHRIVVKHLAVPALGNAAADVGNRVGVPVRVVRREAEDVLRADQLEQLEHVPVARRDLEWLSRDSHVLVEVLAGCAAEPRRLPPQPAVVHVEPPQHRRDPRDAALHQHHPQLRVLLEHAVHDHADDVGHDALRHQRVVLEVEARHAASDRRDAHRRKRLAGRVDRDRDTDLLGRLVDRVKQRMPERLADAVGAHQAGGDTRMPADPANFLRRLLRQLVCEQHGAVQALVAVAQPVLDRPVVGGPGELGGEVRVGVCGDVGAGAERQQPTLDPVGIQQLASHQRVARAGWAGLVGPGVVAKDAAGVGVDLARHERHRPVPAARAGHVLAPAGGEVRQQHVLRRPVVVDVAVDDGPVVHGPHSTGGPRGRPRRRPPRRWRSETAPRHRRRPSGRRGR